MQRQVLIKTLQAKEPFKRRLLHLANVGESHVVADERQNLLRFVIGKSQAAADFLSDSNAYLDVPVKTNTVRRYAKGRRFPNVVEQSTPGQRHRYSRRKAIEQHQRVYPDIAFRVVLRWLRHSLK